jgi:ATP-binding cassette, subfamily B, bacterial
VTAEDAVASSPVTVDPEHDRSYLRDFGRLIPYLRRYWGLALGSVSMIGVGSLVSLISPWPLAILLDTVLGNKPLPALLGPLFGGASRYQLLVFAVVFGLLVTALENGLAVVDNYIHTKLEQRVVLDFRSDLFQHAQRLSMTFHDTTASGGLMFRLSNEATAAGTIAVSVSPLIQAIVTVVLMFLVAFRLDAVLALIALGIVPFIYLSAGYYLKRIQPRVYEVRNLEGQTMSILYEAMAMLRVIVAFGREGHEYRRFRTQGETAIDARVKLTVRQTVFSLAVGMITALGTALVLGVGAYHVLQHQLTAGELMVMLGYVSSIYQPLEQISNTFSTLQQTFIGFRYALDLLDTEPEVKEAPGALSVDRVEGRVAFDGVSFAYRAREHTVRDISFAVEPGQRVAIVGPTGAGKTTLVSLMMRFYDPSDGRITLDGIDIRALTLKSLRDQISVVLQEPLLFAGSVAENIRYGKLEASDEEIAAAAKAANAHDFIERLPSGYDTRMGERGAQLSGGERQRICVARAFLKDAPILVLDEPTSSVDSKTEAVILEALDTLMEGRTSFMIAHRLSTVRRADLIIVLSDGRVVQMGHHEQLAEQDGLYRQLYELQLGEQRRRRAMESRAISAVRQLIETMDENQPGNGARATSSLVVRVRQRLWPDLSPDQMNGGRAEAAWLVLGATVPLLEEGDEEPLEMLAQKASDPLFEKRLAAEVAAALLADINRIEAGA